MVASLPQGRRGTLGHSKEAGVRTFEFFYDFTSPYSYLASTRVPDLCRRTGAEARWRPFLLGGVFKAVGTSAPIESPAKAKHMMADLERWSRRLGVTLRWPATFPVPSILALRCALAAAAQGKVVPFSQAAFRAVWVDGRDLALPETVAALGDEVGLDGKALVASAPDFKAALVRETQEAVERGAFGAPVFFVGDEMFLGNDRLDFVEEALRR
jgi:2-hydroxychromene-2-carboxylate isomerase